ncbi:MAG: gamma-glutamyltransferase family protein, partial [Alphaproteobacteria bacterium]|nr:gamma-glutamyltransferase family protein [Alphaproteobacteria bacterium]
GVMRRSPVIPGTGLVPSGRGNQSRTDPAHPSCLVPGKRPRLTPNPAFAAAPGWTMPFGTPGGDLQTQAMLQFFLNLTVFGLDPQAAVEAPRFGSFSFPDSFSPHPYYPGLLKLEPEMPKRLGKALAERGHTVEWWTHEDWSGTGVCAVVADKKTGVLYGAADRRRTSYALGW